MRRDSMGGWVKLTITSTAPVLPVLGPEAGGLLTVTVTSFCPSTKPIAAATPLPSMV